MAAHYLFISLLADDKEFSFWALIIVPELKSLCDYTYYVQYA